MRQTINQVEDDELYLEINRVDTPKGGYYLKIFRQYKDEEPIVRFEAFLLEHDLDNFVSGLQRARYFQKELYPLEPDVIKNFGQH
jgi:hypothetical protein